jgi:hypothetical protein
MRLKRVLPGNNFPKMPILDDKCWAGPRFMLVCSIDYNPRLDAPLITALPGPIFPASFQIEEVQT